MSAALNAVAALERRVSELEAENAALRDGLSERPDFTAYVFKLTKAEGKVLGCLVKLGTASRGQLMLAIHGKPVVNDWKMVDVLVCRIRQKLARFGLTIESVRSVGYSMTEDDRAKVREIMGEAAQ